MATTETMTIHKALAELKILDDRIISAIGDLHSCIANKHSNDKVKGVSLTEYKTVMQSSYDKSVDLITRRKAIKKAVVLSNARTEVEIAGKKCTVAEAIEMKNHGIEYEQRLVTAMKTQYAYAQKVIAEENGEKLERKADNLVATTYGNREGKTDSAEIAKFRKDFIDAQTYELITIPGFNEKVEEIEKGIADFLAEVDSALSVSNALTTITIEY